MFQLVQRAALMMYVGPQASPDTNNIYGKISTSIIFKLNIILPNYSFTNAFM